MLQVAIPRKIAVRARVHRNTPLGAIAVIARNSPIPAYPAVAKVLRTMVGEVPLFTQMSDSFPNPAQAAA